MKGIGTALITPFKADKSIDWEALARLLDKQIAGHIDYIVVLGTTGETATLSIEEKKAISAFIVNHVQGRIPLVLGIGGNNTQNVVHEILSTDLTPYSAILSVCPYYNKPSQEGLFQHYCAIARVTPIPIILYNVPGRTGVNLLPETAIRIWESYPNKIMGVKEASGNVEQIKRLIILSQKAHQKQSTQTALQVISGDDSITAELLQAGAVGLISVASNAFPEDFAALVHNVDRNIQVKYEKMIGLLFKEGNPAGIKTTLHLQGIIENELRLPLVQNSIEIQEEIRVELQKL